MSKFAENSTMVKRTDLFDLNRSAKNFCLLLHRLFNFLILQAMRILSQKVEIFENHKIICLLTR
jgi:hypothetical protein